MKCNHLPGTSATGSAKCSAENTDPPDSSPTWSVHLKFKEFLSDAGFRIEAALNCMQAIKERMHEYPEANLRSYNKFKAEFEMGIGMFDLVQQMFSHTTARDYYRSMEALKRILDSKFQEIESMPLARVSIREKNS